MSELNTLIPIASAAIVSMIGAIAGAFVTILKLRKPNANLQSKNAILEKCLELSLGNDSNEIKKIIKQIIDNYNKTAPEEYKINIKVD